MNRQQLLTFFIFIFSLVNAQNENDFLGKGARAAGMAYAFSAISDDATALSWNPAGIVQIKKPEFAFVNSLTTTKREGRYEKLNYKPTYMIEYIGFVYPLKIKMKDLVFGLSFQNKMNFKYNNTSVSSVLSNHEGRNKITVNAVTLCGAYAINRLIAAGFSYNKWFSLGNEEHTFDEYTSRIDTTTNYNFYNSSKLSGNNITAGVFFNFETLHFPLRFAIKYENSFVLKRNYNETWHTDYIYKNYEDSSFTNAYGGTEKFYIPHIITTGVSYRIGDYFTIACDIDYRIISGKAYEWNYRRIDNCTANNQVTLLKDTIQFGEISYDELSSELHQYRFGMEYILHFKSALIPLRFGWKNNQTTLINRLYTSPSKVYAHSLNFGTGFISKRFSIDFAYEQYKYEITDDHNNIEKKRYGFFILSTIIYLN